MRIITPSQVLSNRSLSFRFLIDSPLLKLEKVSFEPWALRKAAEAPLFRDNPMTRNHQGEPIEVKDPSDVAGRFRTSGFFGKKLVGGGPTPGDPSKFLKDSSFKAPATGPIKRETLKIDLFAGEIGTDLRFGIP